MTPEDRTFITEQIAASEDRITGAQGRAVESIATEISNAREEILSQIEALNIRLDRIDTRLAASEHQMGGIQKWMAATERLQSQTLATQ